MIQLLVKHVGRNHSGSYCKVTPHDGWEFEIILDIYPNKPSNKLPLISRLVLKVWVNYLKQCLTKLKPDHFERCSTTKTGPQLTGFKNFEPISIGQSTE